MKKYLISLFYVLLPLLSYTQAPAVIKNVVKTEATSLSKITARTPTKVLPTVTVPTVTVSTGFASAAVPRSVRGPLKVHSPTVYNREVAKKTLEAIESLGGKNWNFESTVPPMSWEEFKWRKEEKNDPTAKGVDHDAYPNGRLAKLDVDSRKIAETDFAAAFESVQHVARYTDEYVSSMVASRKKGLKPNQIELALKDIEKASALVKKAWVSLGEAPALKEMTAYLNYAKRFYTSLDTGVYEPLEEMEVFSFFRKDGHKYVNAEFGLWTDAITKPSSILSYIKSLIMGSEKVEASLPQKLRVAVMLENEEYMKPVIKKLQEMEKFKEWDIVVTFPYAGDFVLYSDFNSYDLILTGIVTKDGGGRYLARRLRSKDYEGSILGMSFRFDATEDFFNDGMDGFLQLKDMPLNDVEGAANWMGSRIENYYAYKQKYGWIH